MLYHDVINIIVGGTESQNHPYFVHIIIMIKIKSKKIKTIMTTF